MRVLPDKSWPRMYRDGPIHVSVQAVAKWTDWKRWRRVSERECTEWSDPVGRLLPVAAGADGL